MNESNMPEWWNEQDQDEAWIAQQEKELERYDAECDDPIIFPEFAKALVGYGVRFSHRVAIYDYARCLDILEGNGLSYEDAIEWMEYNVVGAYLGESTPVFLTMPVKKGKAKKQITEQLRLDLGPPHE